MDVGKEIAHALDYWNLDHKAVHILMNILFGRVETGSGYGPAQKVIQKTK